MTDHATTGSMSRRQFTRRISLAMLVGLAVLLAMAWTAWRLGDLARSHGAWVEHTYAAEAKVLRLQSLVERVETARRGYLLQQRDAPWRTYETTVAAVPRALQDLAEFISDNPVQVARVKRLQPLVGDKLNAVAESMTLAHVGDVDMAIERFRAESSFKLTTQIRQVTDEMLAEEQKLLGARSAEQASTTRNLLLVVTLGALLVAALAAAAFWTIRRYASDLEASQTALRQFNLGLESQVQARTAELTRANAEIQRFAYIVSHDLRSPLVNVMGFTSELEVSLKPLRELVAGDGQPSESVRRDAKLAVEQDLPEAIGFIRSSTQKMDRLINAILKLSREGRRNLSPEPVDMTALVRSTADTLKSVAHARGAEITLEGELPPIVTDRLAVEQVMGNLLENAIKYASPKRAGRVTVRGAQEGDRLIYEVEDNGRGIDPKDHERVFDLFRRAGAQDQPGEGIGLAHVRAMVHRLGGRITVSSELDRGASFRLFLPSTLSPEPNA